MMAFAEAPPAPAKPESVQPLRGVTNLHGIVVVPRYEDINVDGVTGVRGVVVKGPAFLRSAAFEKLLRPYLGKTMTEASLYEVQIVIRKYCQAHDHLIVDVVTGEQDIPDGTVQIAVVEGKIGKRTVEGNKWFSDSVLLRNIRLKPGDTVLESRLDGDVNWLNRNTYQSLGYFTAPFLEMTPEFTRGGLPGETDVAFKAKDRFPLRLFAGIEDSGIEVIGRDRLFAGFNWANAFGLDHRLSYQYITDTDFDKFQEHVASYVIPLPWRHELTVFGAYADINPDFSVIQPNFNKLINKGTFYQLSARYAIPLPQFRQLSHEISAGFDFKRTDTPLLFETSIGSLPLTTNKVDIAQFSLGYSGRFKDKLGVTAFSIQGVYSPGGLTDFNTDPAFVDFSQRTNAQAQYFYGRAEIRRETFLPLGFTWYTRAGGQYSDSKLVATEVFSLGGYDTVRGYDERVVSGDHGWLLVNELRTPRLALGNLTGRPAVLSNPTGKAAENDGIRALVFCDYGGVINRSTAQGDRFGEVLLSVGAGFRYELADNLRVRFDYGFQLDREYLTAPSAANLGKPPDRRAHFGLEISF